MLSLLVSILNNGRPTQLEVSNRSIRDPLGATGGVRNPIPVGEMRLRLRTSRPCSRIARATNSPVNDKATTSAGASRLPSHSASQRAYMLLL